MMAMIEQPTFTVYSHDDMRTKHPRGARKLETMPGECAKWITFNGDRSEPFDVSTELMQDAARLPWEIVVLSYDREHDCYKVRLGDLKSGARSYCNEN